VGEGAKPPIGIFNPAVLYRHGLIGGGDAVARGKRGAWARHCSPGALLGGYGWWPVAVWRQWVAAFPAVVGGRLWRPVGAGRPGNGPGVEKPMDSSSQKRQQQSSLNANCRIETDDEPSGDRVAPRPTTIITYPCCGPALQPLVFPWRGAAG